MSRNYQYGSTLFSSNSSRSRKYNVRVCLLGEAGCGKSSLFYRVKHQAFRDSPEELEKTQTLSAGPNSRTRFYDSYSTVRKPDPRTKISLTLMDTGSRERYQSLTAQYYKRANVIVLVCSLDSEFTLARLTKWHAEAQYYIDNSEILYAVVGTKSDLPETEREVSQDMLHSFAQHLNIPLEFVYEVSSQTGEGVEAMLTSICETVIKQFYHGSRRPEAVHEETLLLSDRVGNTDDISINTQATVVGSINEAETAVKHKCPCCSGSTSCTCSCCTIL